MRLVNKQNRGKEWEGNTPTYSVRKLKGKGIVDSSVDYKDDIS